MDAKGIFDNLRARLERKIDAAFEERDKSRAQGLVEASEEVQKLAVDLGYHLDFVSKYTEQ